MIGALAFGSLLIVAAACDIARLRIPNAIPLALIGVFGVLALLGQHTVAPSHVLAMLIVLLVLLPFFALNMLGGGDVKLLAAAALWLGSTNVFPLLVVVGVLGGLFALFWLPLRWLIGRAVPTDRLPASLRARAALPYGVPIAAGAMLLYGQQAGPSLLTGGIVA